MSEHPQGLPVEANAKAGGLCYWSGQQGGSRAC